MPLGWYPPSRIEQFVKWLMEHQKEASLFTTIARLVDSLAAGLSVR
jgi:hypothetical protein